MNKPNRKKRAQIESLKAEISDLKKRLSEMDFWFIKNVGATDWTEKINQYWVLQSKLEEKTEQRNRLAAGKSRFSPNIEYPINNSQTL